MRRKKTGGRQKGTRNKVTARREADENEDTPRRDEMAKAAAPYCHPRLSTVDAKVSVNNSLAEALDALKAQNGS